MAITQPFVVPPDGRRHNPQGPQRYTVVPDPLHQVTQGRRVLNISRVAHRQLALYCLATRQTMQGTGSRAILEFLERQRARELRRLEAEAAG